MDNKFKYSWNLKDIYENIDEFNSEIKFIKKRVLEIIKYKGTLNHSNENLIKCLNLSQDISERLFKLEHYSYLKYLSDISSNNSMSQYHEILLLIFNVRRKLSFISSEIYEFNNKKIKFILNDSIFRNHNKIIHQILNQKKHRLSINEEKIISQISEITPQFKNIYDNLINTTKISNQLINIEGLKIELNQSNINKYLINNDREIRKAAFNAKYMLYKTYSNIHFLTLTNNIKKDNFYTTIRNYKTTLDKSLKDEIITKKEFCEYTNYIANNMKIMNKYLKLRKDKLNLKKLHFYDLEVDIFNYKFEVNIEKAEKILLKAFSILGNQYTNIIKKAFNENWIHINNSNISLNYNFTKNLKNVHPFISINYNNNLNSLLMLSHELGHAAYNYLLNDTHKSILLNEIIAVTNEILLFKYIIKNARTISEKCYLEYKYISYFIRMVFRHSMFAEFELSLHNIIEKKEQLNLNKVCNIYLSKISKFYNAEHFETDEIVRYEWVGVSHFYKSFYIIRYPISFLIAKCIVDNLDNNSNNYITILKTKDTNIIRKYLNEKFNIMNISLESILDSLESIENYLNNKKKGVRLKKGAE